MRNNMTPKMTDAQANALWAKRYANPQLETDQELTQKRAAASSRAVAAGYASGAANRELAREVRATLTDLAKG